MHSIFYQTFKFIQTNKIKKQAASCQGTDQGTNHVILLINFAGIRPYYEESTWRYTSLIFS